MKTETMSLYVNAASPWASSGQDIDHIKPYLRRFCPAPAQRFFILLLFLSTNSGMRFLFGLPMRGVHARPFCVGAETLGARLIHGLSNEMLAPCAMPRYATLDRPPFSLSPWLRAAQCRASDGTNRLQLQSSRLQMATDFLSPPNGVPSRAPCPSWSRLP